MTTITLIMMMVGVALAVVAGVRALPDGVSRSTLCDCFAQIFLGAGVIFLAVTADALFDALA